MAESVVSDISGSVIGFVFQTVTDDPAVKALGDLFAGRSITVYDQCSVLGKKFGEPPERSAYIVNIFEKIQLIRIDVQNDADRREKA